jgi:hypothetical protein
MKRDRSEYLKNYRKQNALRLDTKRRLYEYKRNYGATDQDYENYLSVTHCQCCGVKFGCEKTLLGKCQDHCHDTSILRGVICGRCNLIEGMAKDKNLLLAVYQYKLNNETNK